MKRLAWIAFGVVYTISPLDGDWFPVLGWVDDAVIDVVCAVMALRNQRRKL